MNIKKLFLVALLMGVALFVGCGGGSSSGGGGGTVNLQSIAITPASPSIGVKATQQFTATGSYSDGTTKNLTSTANWLSSNGAVATINISGLATAVAVGTTTITATSGTVTGTATLTVAVPLVSIAVTPSTATINPVAPGNTQLFTAIGTFVDNTTKDLTATATWQSSNSNIATVTGGLATAVAPGQTTITATSGGISGTAALNTNPLTSIAVTPTNSKAAPGTKPLFVATGTYFDGTTNIITTSVAWTSSNTAAATIANAQGTQGQATAIAPGNTTITATLGSIAGSTSLTVTNAKLTKIDVNPQSGPISLNSHQQYTATGTYDDNTTQDITNVVTWKSSDTTKITITTGGNGGGDAFARNITTNQVIITASYQGINGTATATVDAATLVSIAIAPNNFGLAMGTSRLFTATGTFTDGSTATITSQADWTSAPTSVANVGLHTGLVKAATSVTNNHNAATITVKLGAVSQQFTLDVTNATPKFVTVTPIQAAIAAGTTQDFKATGTFSDGSSQDITLDSAWSSSNTAVASIASSGRAFGKAAGVASITAKFVGIVSTPVAQLTVNGVTLSSIAVIPASTLLTPGSSIIYQAVGTFSDNSTAFIGSLVTWASDSAAVLITGAGIATAQFGGTANITATYQGVTSNKAAVTVTASQLISIAVSPPAQFLPTANIPVGVTVPFTAIGTFADSTTQNLTSSVTWTSTSALVGTVSNAFPRQGFVTAVGPGSTSITAVFVPTGTSNTPPTPVVVTNATIQSIAITPANPSATLGSSVKFTAQGTFSGVAQPIDLTTQVTWTSSDATVATVSSNGQASTASIGSALITATFTQNGQQVSGTTTLTVH